MARWHMASALALSRHACVEVGRGGEGREEPVAGDAEHVEESVVLHHHHHLPCPLALPLRLLRPRLLHQKVDVLQLQLAVPRPHSHTTWLQPPRPCICSDSTEFSGGMSPVVLKNFPKSVCAHNSDPAQAPNNVNVKINSILRPVSSKKMPLDSAQRVDEPMLAPLFVEADQRRLEPFHGT
eukprot:2684540-Rhodomonas_salina.1